MFGINLEEAWNNAVDYVSDAAEDVGEFASDVADAAVETYNQVTGQVIDGVEQAGETLAQIGSEVGAKVSEVTETVVDAVEETSQSFFGGVAAAVTGFFAAAAEPMRRAGESLGKSMAEAADGVADAFGMVVDGLGDMFIESTSRLLQGDIVGAAESVITGADKVALRSVQRLGNGLINATEDLLKAPTHLVPDPVGEFLRDQVVARTVDIGRTMFNVPAQLTRNYYRTIAEAPLEIVKGGLDAVGHLLRGEFQDAAKDFGMGFANAGARVVGDVVDGVILVAQGAADIIGTALFLHEPSRPLTDDEKAFLRERFGDSLDVDSMRIHEGNITTEHMGIAAHAVGNNIYMPTGRENDSDLFVHESTHTWQSQNGGNDYIHKALLAMGIAVIETGDRNGAYDWKQAANDGKTFDEMNPEEQAMVWETLESARGNDRDGDGEISRGDFSPALTDAEWEAVQQAMRDIPEGDNAP